MSRTFYLVSGVGLTAIKYFTEAQLIRMYTGEFYSLQDFTSPLLSKRMEVFDQAPPWLAWGVICWSIPFIWIAVSMSVRRAHTAGISPWWGLGVLLPLLNLPLMLILAALPDKQAKTTTDEISLTAEETTNGHLWIQAARAIAAGVMLLAATLALSVYWLSEYGAMLFFVAPAAAGALTGYLANRPSLQGLSTSLTLVLVMLICAACGLMLFALEGAICIAMSIPIVFPIGLVGGMIGYLISHISPTGRPDVSFALLLPLGLLVEDRVRELPVYQVTSAIVVNAPPADVWETVVAFPEIPAAEEWFFRAGIAYPTSAHIDGQGVGAIRHCVFTTGEFVEPITAWEPPHRLAFDVSEQPAPMFELSPYHHVHPPHLEGTFQSTQGEFRLIDLGDGRTRLEGTTWYTIEMGPTLYWKLWCDDIIHRIHLRVLNHIRDEVETDVIAHTAGI